MSRRGLERDRSLDIVFRIVMIEASRGCSRLYLSSLSTMNLFWFQHNSNNIRVHTSIVGRKWAAIAPDCCDEYYTKEAKDAN
jgi:hypothetical protein